MCHGIARPDLLERFNHERFLFPRLGVGAIFKGLIIRLAKLICILAFIIRHKMS